MNLPDYPEVVPNWKSQLPGTKKRNPIVTTRIATILRMTKLQNPAQSSLNLSESIDFDGESLQKLKRSWNKDTNCVPMIFAFGSDDTERLLE